MSSAWFGGFAAVLLALPLGACGGGGNGDAATGTDVVANMDSGVTGDGGTMDEGGRQARDVPSNEVSLADTMGTCFMAVSPRMGAASATFVATGQGFSDPMVVIGLLMGTTMVGSLTTLPTTSDGMGSQGFMYTIPTGSLAPGMYTLSARDMSTFTCQFSAPFTITP